FRDGAARGVVAAAAYGDLEAGLSAEEDGIDHVGGRLTPRDRGGPLVDEPVMDATGVVVAGGAPRQHGARKRGAQILDSLSHDVTLRSPTIPSGALGRGQGTCKGLSKEAGESWPSDGDLRRAGARPALLGKPAGHPRVLSAHGNSLSQAGL